MRELSSGAIEVRRIRRLVRDRKYRFEEGASAVEGPSLVVEALDAGLDVRLVLVPSGAIEDPAVSALLERTSDLKVKVAVVVDRVFATLASTRSPQPAVAEVGHHDVAPATLMRATLSGKPLLVLVDLADPGNVGTLFRSAEAFGAAGLMIVGGVDPYNPKVVRAAAGSSFRLPFARLDEASDVFSMLTENGVAAWAAVPLNGIPVSEVPIGVPTALVLGNEPRGLAEDQISACVGSTTVSTLRGVESLNVAVAGSVALYELTRDID